MSRASTRAAKTESVRRAKKTSGPRRGRDCRLLRDRSEARGPYPSTQGQARDPVLLAYLKMLTARAATSRIVIAEIADSNSISSFARRVSGIASVGLKAIEFVNET